MKKRLSILLLLFVGIFAFSYSDGSLFRVEEFYSSQEGSVTFEFNEKLLPDRDIKSYINITPQIDFTANIHENSIIINGPFDIKKPYDIELKQGIKSSTDKKLIKNITERINFDDIKPKIVFLNSGSILPSINEKKINFESVNVKSATVSVKKVFQNNTTSFLYTVYSFKGSSGLNYDFEYNFDRLGKEVFNKKYDLNYNKNKWMKNEIDLSKVIDSNGIYVVSLSFNNNKDTDYKADRDDYYYYYSNSAEKIIILSDIGIIAQKTPTKTLVTTTNILTNEVMPNVKIKAIDRANQLIDEKVTDGNGEVTFNNTNNIYYLIAEQGDERSILRMYDSKINYKDFKVYGNTVLDGMKAYVFTERDVYRPGEEINLSVILRNDKEAIYENHPINISFYSPQNEKVLNDVTVKDHKNGFYTYKLKTNTNDITGVWNAVVKIGDYTVQKSIAIEAFVPDRIKTDIIVDEVVDSKQGNEVPIELKSKYLFGAPASNLPYSIRIVPKVNTSMLKEYPSYRFDNPTDYDYIYEDYLDGKLDENGNAKTAIPLEGFASKSLNVNLSLIVEIKDTNGRSASSRKDIEYNKFDTLVGIEKLTNYYYEGNSKIGLNVISISKDGQNFIKDKKLKYNVYVAKNQWWWDYDNIDYFYKSVKDNKDTLKIETGEFITSDKPEKLEIKTPNRGEVIVEVIDESTGQSAMSSFYVSSWSDESVSKNNEILKLTTDKKEYIAGEKAKFLFEASKGSKALITVEKSGEIIKRYWKSIDSESMEEEIEITADMSPNIYVNVLLYQDYANYTNDRPLRLFGTVPIMVRNDDKHLKVKIDAPKDIRPNEKVKIKLSNENKVKMDYTISIVDEGLLSITDFKFKNPFDFFYGKVAMMLQNFDNYSYIIANKLNKVHNVLTPGGGASEEAALLKAAADSKRKELLGSEDAVRFKPVSLFKGVLTSDYQGNAEVEFDIPNYLGSVKVMVVAASNDLYGIASEDITVKAPIVTELSAPRALKVGDEFNVPLKLFALENNIGKVTIKTDFDGIKDEKEVTFNEKGSKSFSLSYATPNKIGVSKFKIEVASSDYTFNDEIEFDVKTNSPYTYINQDKAVEPDKGIVIKPPSEYVQGSTKSSIIISSYDLLNIDKRIKKLIRYPYGCLEQITSIAFSQLYIDNVTLNPEFHFEKIKENINTTIEKISNYQLPNGSFSYWPGNGNTDYWATGYVGEFLMRAKEKGYYVPDAMYNNWLNFVKNNVKSMNTSFNLQIDYLYLLALANTPNVSEMNVIRENNYDNLTLSYKWKLLAAYSLIGEEEFAKKEADKLSETGFNENISGKKYYYTDTYVKASILRSYNEIYKKQNPELHKELLNLMRSKSWISTSEASAILRALGLNINVAKAQNLNLQMTVDGIKKDIVLENGIYKEVFKEGIKEINIKNIDKSKAYIYYSWDGFPINYESKDISDNLDLKYSFIDTLGYSPIDPTVSQSGDTFYMIIRITPSALNNNYELIENLALSQILPSGWEIDNPRLSNWQIYNKEITKHVKKDNYVDIRDDRIIWFFDYNSHHKTPIDHIIKINVITPGKYTMPGPTVEAMYDNNYKAHKKGIKVEVK